jgi:hypothetical protein
MVWFSAKKAVPAAAVVGAIALAISGGTAVPIHRLAKRYEFAVWGGNLGNLIATVKDFLQDVNAYVSTPYCCLEADRAILCLLQLVRWEHETDANNIGHISSRHLQNDACDLERRRLPGFLVVRGH